MSLAVKDANGANQSIETLPPLGQSTKSASLPVTFPSDVDPVPVKSTTATGSGSITTQNLVPAGAATAGSAVEITLDGSNGLIAQVTGTYTGALSLQVTVDGSNWITVGGTPLVNLNTGGYLASITSALQSIFQADVAGAIKARITGLAAMTGTAVVTLRAVMSSSMVALDAAIPAGTAIIGALVADQAVNVSKINGVAPLMGSGVNGTGAQRMSLATDQAALSVAGVFSVKLDQTTPGTTNAVTPVPAAAAGASTSHHAISAASTNATSVKASAGRVSQIIVSNLNAAVRYLKLYNKASAPTVGTDTPIATIAIPAGGTIVIPCGPDGMRFSTGIAYALTTGITVADTGAVSASEHAVHMQYT